jgi:histidinol-phosphate aminotransferase
MQYSRRKFFRTLGIGAAVGTAAQLPLTSIASAAAYEPAKSKDADGFVRLSDNENAYGPSAKTAAAIRSALGSVNRYPYLEYQTLANRIANLHHVKPEQVVVGCGSTEILRVAATAFLGSDKQLVQASPTFEAIETYAQATGAKVTSVALTKEFAHDLNAMLAHVDDNTTLLYICNPNNPTASLTPRRDLEAFIEKLPAHCFLVIDEAYHHYAGQSSMYRSFLDEPVHNDRVIVCRTFSKIYGLASLRLGYAIASPDVAKRIGAYLTQDNINGIGLKAAMAALDDSESATESARRNADIRQEFFNQAMARMLKPIDSHANFVMMNVDHRADEVIEHFRNNNILIGRHFPAMNTYVRISLGTTEDMKAFWRVWDKLPFAQKMSM